MGNESSVRAWEETVTIPTYPTPPPDKNPMFLDKRIYQGSSGKVYPNPFTDRVSDEKRDLPYRAVFLENEFLRVMILPEIGGRIHVGQDKTNGYEFFYRQQVIKPALVGLLGPWISGGVEFNWPQHHRPSTFMPVEYAIEEREDGSRIVWLSEHEPMNRMKGMAGICLYPGKAFLEAKVRLYNRTPFVQTFLWWANVGVHVHDQYQAFFPPDVHFVADHAKRAMSWYPIARNFYYGVDYRRGVDISWYKNIPVPTSYMATQSSYDFVGGYDYSKRAGLVHYANHHIAPGKKLWTWGNAEFGYAWDRELTDSDGPYVELMAGVYTDNQPDFSWLHPYETKTFSQYWYPIQVIGPAKNANRLLAVNLERTDESKWSIGIYATESIANARVVLTAGNNTAFEEQTDLQPGKPFVGRVSVLTDAQLRLTVFDQHGNELIHYAPQPARDVELPSPATEPPAPEAIASTDELYVTGLHLEQYRHATRSPEPYWREALKRDPGDARSNNALGLLALRRGKFGEAGANFEAAISRLTKRNPNPYDGEPFYNLGVARTFEQRIDDAYAAFYKAAWNYAWQSAAYYELAAIDSSRGCFERALEHVDRSLNTNVDHLKARNLKAAILRNRETYEEATRIARETTELDRLDFWCRNEMRLLGEGDERDRLTDELFAVMRHDAQNCLDLAFDYAHAGLWTEAAELIDSFLAHANDTQLSPMLFYSRAFVAKQNQNTTDVAKFYELGRNASPDYCFPARLEEMIVLEAALNRFPEDARAHYYIGNLLYDKLRPEEAIHHWEEAARLDPAFSIPWRNLGIAYYNVRRNSTEALEAYRRARQANPNDARLLYEFDQLQKRTGVAPEQRLAELEQQRELVDQRDDLTIELVTLCNQTGQSERALAILSSRRFHPWEGGEGLVSGQFFAAHLLLGRDALDGGDARTALRHFDAARRYPPNLGEGKHLLTEEADADYFSGIASSLLGREQQAAANWTAAAAARPGPSRHSYYAALALRKLGHDAAATEALTNLRQAAEAQMHATVKVDYFATSLPNFLLFDDDLQKRNQIDCLFVRGLANLGLGYDGEAAGDLQKVLDLDRNHLWARVELARILTRAEQPAQTR
ncbi:MAG: DUF5107 domain-containing protein [Acidobacteriaceae bacterium]|nr:DUF5107 domain-containing protein [Acidobacteriaceae bacterium]